MSQPLEVLAVDHHAVIALQNLDKSTRSQAWISQIEFIE
jgi:hypothetical protein